MQRDWMREKEPGSVSAHIKVSGDLRDFMPPAQTDDQKLLMDEIGNGPASQLLLVAILHFASGELDAED